MALNIVAERLRVSELDDDALRARIGKLKESFRPLHEEKMEIGNKLACATAELWMRRVRAAYGVQVVEKFPIHEEQIGDDPSVIENAISRLEKAGAAITGVDFDPLRGIFRFYGEPGRRSS